MSNAQYVKDLVLLIADLDAENALRGILQRWKALGIRKLVEGRQFDILRHPQRDPGCRCNAEGFLEGFVRSHRHALVVFDYHGCGVEHLQPAANIEADLERRLAAVGWVDRCAVVVIEPELEAWVWSDSSHVDSELGWNGHRPPLRLWLEESRLLTRGASKPIDPKTAMLRVMREANKPPSPRIFSRLAETVSLSRCQDRAFLKLKSTIQNWFNEQQPVLLQPDRDNP